MQAGFSRVVAGWSMTAALALAAGPFAMPQEGPLPFRRDRLPVDADTMRSVSMELTQWANATEVTTPEERLRVARTLALAVALYPANVAARELMGSLRDQHAVEPFEHAPVRPSERLERLLAWLETDEAGPDGRALAACLGDVMAAYGAGADERTEQGAWKGWVPSLAAYRPPPEPEAVERLKEPVKPKVQSPPIMRREGRVSTPLWTWNAMSERMELRNVELAMKVTAPGAGDEPAGFGFSVERAANGAPLAAANQTVVAALRTMHGALPAAHVGLSAGSADLSRRGGANGPVLTAAAAVLMDAVLSGREPAGTVVGVVGKDGQLAAPQDLWERLRLLSTAEGGGRLVLPREAESWLPAFLTFENPGFFLKYEVVYASNVRELVERAVAKPHGPAGEAAVRFEEIRAKAGTGVAAFVANRFVRQRLAEIVQLFPDHASANLLLLQGSGDRPLKLPGKVLAAEIHDGLAPLVWIGKLEWYEEIPLAKIERAQDLCRSEADRLERYADGPDKALLAGYRELVSKLRTFARAKRDRGAPDYDSRPQQTAAGELRKTYEDYRSQIRAAAGGEEEDG
jgi:hypothetical protein